MKKYTSYISSLHPPFDHMNMNLRMPVPQKYQTPSSQKHANTLSIRNSLFFGNNNHKKNPLNVQQFPLLKARYIIKLLRE